MLKLLFTPIRVGQMEMKNRIVMPAMHFLSSWDRFVLPHHTDYFVERARGGASLIIIGGCTIDETSGAVNMLSVRDDKFHPLPSPRSLRPFSLKGRKSGPSCITRDAIPIPCSWGEINPSRLPRSVPGSRARLRGSCPSRRSRRSRGISPSRRRGSGARVSMR